MNLTEYLDIIPEDDVFHSTKGKLKFEFDEDIEMDINAKISERATPHESGMDDSTSINSSANKEHLSDDDNGSDA